MKLNPLMKYLNYRMINSFCILLMILLLEDCSSSKKIQIEQLSGYWEIDFISQKGENFIPKGKTLLFDHYQLKYPKGILNKVATKLNGTLMTSDDAISFNVEKINKNYYIRFKSTWDIWSRKICFLDSQSLILKNGEREFHYKRPLKLIP